MGILLIGMLASFASQITSGQIIDSSQDATIIVADLERCMEEVILQPADDIPTVYPEGVAVPGYTGLHVREERIVPRYLNWTPGDTIPDLLEIELAATWVDGVGRMQSQTLLTAKSR